MKIKFIYILIFSCGLFSTPFVSGATYSGKDSVRLNRQLESIFKIKNLYPDSCLVLLTQLGDSCRNNGFMYGEGKSIHIRAYIKSYQGKYDEARKLFWQAIHIRNNVHDYKGLANSYDGIALLYKKYLTNDSAAYYFYEALRIRETNVTGDLIKSYNNLMNFYEDVKDFSKAFMIYDSAKHVFDELTDLSSLSKVMNNKAGLQIILGNNQEAENILKQAETYCQDEKTKAEILGNLAIVYKNNGDYSSAEHLWIEVLHIDSVLQNAEGLAEDFNNLGVLCEAEARLELSLDNFLKSVLICKRIGLNNLLLKNYYEIATVYQKLNDYNNAYRFIYNASKLTDSLNNLNKSELVEIVRAKYETEKKDQLLLIKSEQLKSKTLSSRIFLIASSSLVILLVISIIFFLQQRRLTRRKALLAQQQIESLLNDQELKSINAMLEGQDNERKRIAEDLHDRVGSILSTVKLYFGSLNTKIDSYQDENKKQYDQANTLLDEAVQEVRRISHNLISGILMKFGLVPALKDLCDTVEGTQQLKINLKVFNVDERMDGQTEISIYRIIQELLSNVLKHAKATEITISLTRNDGNLNIIVEDNGKGFDANMNYEGIGLKNIRSRVEKLNGQVKFDSVIDRGTTVIIDLPVDETPNDV